MAFSGLFQELWGDIALQEFMSVASIASVCNRDYDGTIRRKGDTVSVPFFDPSSLTIQSSWESGSADTDFGTVVQVSVDQDPAVQVEIMSIDTFRTNTNLQAETARAAGRALANNTDSTIISTVSGAATLTDAITSYDTLIEARALLTGGGVPVTPGDVWYFASATQAAALLKDDDIMKSLMHVTPNNAITTGFIGTIGGINIVEQNVTAGGGIMFHRDALAFVSQVEIEFEIDSMLGGQKKRGNVLGAFLLYGVKVLSTKGVAHITNS